MSKKIKPTREEAEEAVRTLIRWAGDNPEREGLIETPKRVVKSYEEFFSGYNKSLDQGVKKLFQNNYGYNDVISLNHIRFESHCEHHMVQIIGDVHISYLPDQHIIGLSKLARVVDIFAKRLQIQERLTVEIARAIDEIIEPKGVSVVIDSNHHCLSTRGIHKTDSKMRTFTMLGIFQNKEYRQEILNQIEKK